MWLFCSPRQATQSSSFMITTRASGPSLIRSLVLSIKSQPFCLVDQVPHSSTSKKHSPRPREIPSTQGSSSSHLANLMRRMMRKRKRKRNTTDTTIMLVNVRWKLIDHLTLSHILLRDLAASILTIMLTTREPFVTTLTTKEEIVKIIRIIRGSVHSTHMEQVVLIQDNKLFLRGLPTDPVHRELHLALLPQLPSMQLSWSILESSKDVLQFSSWPLIVVPDLQLQLQILSQPQHQRHLLPRSL